jgi:hypothetical protein
MELMDIYKEARRSTPMLAQLVFGLEPQSHHFEWEKNMQVSHRVLEIAPRGSSKTTWLIINLLRQISNLPHLAHVYVAPSYNMAVNVTIMLRNTIVHNEAYKQIYPEIHLDGARNNSATQFSLGNGVRDSLPTFTACPVDRLEDLDVVAESVFAIDDVITEQTDEDKTFIDVNNALCELRGDCRIWHYTSRWNEFDLAGSHLTDSTFKVGRTPAFTKGELGHLVSYWPEVWPVSRLLKTMREIGVDNFNTQFMGCVD